MNNKISVIIPYRPTNRQREKIANWCIRRLEWLYPEAEFIIHSSNDRIFSRGKSINEGVQKSTGDYLIITDSDYIFSEKFAQDIVNKHSWTIGVKTERYFFLNEAQTDCVLSQEINSDIEKIITSKNTQRNDYFVYGGVLAMPRENFIKFDYNLVGYGYEDNIWYYCMKNYYGREWRTSERMYHMFHDRVSDIEYLSFSHRNKRYHDEVWLPVRKDTDATKVLIERLRLK